MSVKLLENFLTDAQNKKSLPEDTIQHPPAGFIVAMNIMILRYPGSFSPWLLHALFSGHPRRRFRHSASPSGNPASAFLLPGILCTPAFCRSKNVGIRLSGHHKHCFTKNQQSFGHRKPQISPNSYPAYYSRCSF